MAKFKAAPLADRNKRFGVAGAFGALAAAFAGKAAAQTAEAPAGFDPLSALGEIREVTQLADGTLQVVLESGKTIIVSAADFVVVGTEFFIAESAVATLLAVPAGLGAGAVLGGVGAVGAVGAVAGGGGGGDDAPPVSPPPPPPPPAASPVFTSGTTATFAENGTGTVYTAAATDADSPTLTYSITGGADASRFTINATTGVVTFVSPPNFEAPTDAGADNVYELQITASDGTNAAVRSVAVTVTNINDVAPVFTSGTTATFAENGTGTVYTAAATDADSASVTYAITGGADAQLFSINAATGAVTFISPPDFEAKRRTSEDGPRDSGNVYELQITASDGTLSTVQSVSVTVTNVNDVAPVFLSGGTATVAENSTGTAYGVVAFDPDSPTITYSITGGADAAQFTINATTGIVTFVAPPNFDAPADDGKNNVYDIQITASDGTLSTVQTVAVTVTNVNDEAPSFNSGTTATFAENGTGTVYTAAATDADSTTVTYAITGGADAARFAIDPATGVVTFVSSPNFEAPTDAGTNNVYDIQITASDGTNTAVQNVAVTVTDVFEAAQVIDLSTLSAAQGFIIQGDSAGDQAGSFVSSAGDVNGDGFEDLIIGAPFENAGGSETGDSYVVFGSASGFGTDVSGRRVIDLTTLSASQGFIIRGGSLFERSGYSVSSAGDINGDGFDDLTIGAPTSDLGGGSSGHAYVVFGGSGTFGTNVSGRQVITTASLSASQGFVIQGDLAGDRAGQSVASAGDVNGDGYDDLIVGANNAGGGGSYSGNVYVVFGGAGTFGVTSGVRQIVDLTNLVPSQGFVIFGDSGSDATGISVSSAGDINGDGFDDLIVGANGGDDGGNNAGEAYVVFGGAGTFGTPSGGRQVIDLTSLSAAQGFVIQGDSELDRLGASVSSAGDVNGDGFDDLIVGANRGGDGGANAGEAYVVFGSAAGFGTTVNMGGFDRQVIDLTSLSASQGFIIQGDTAGDVFGNSVSSAGDVNGDGFDDLIVGANGGDDGGSGAGEAYVVFGGAGTFGTTVGGRQVIDLTNLSASQGLIIQGDESQDNAGRSVSSAGDVNGDGFDDLFVGANRGNDGGYGAGEGYVIFGGATGTESTVAVTRTGTASADNFTGNAGNDTFTSIGANDVVRGGAGDDAISLSATTFADINGGQGTDTLALSGSGMTLNLTGAGTARIQSIEVIDLTGTGNNTVVLDQQAVFDLTEERSGGTATITIRGNAGDTADLGGATGGFTANGTVTDSGITYDIYSNGNANVRVQTGVTVLNAPTPAQRIEVATLSAGQGFIIQGDYSSDQAGFSVSSAGDVNGDGFDDLIVGARGGDDGSYNAGETYVVFGGAGGFGATVNTGGVDRQVIDLTTLNASQGFIIQGDSTYDQAGFSVSSAGDVNGDGFADLIIGTPYGEDGGSSAGEGETYVVFGAAGGFGLSDGAGRQVLQLRTLSASEGFIIRGDSPYDLAGFSVSSAGDVNGDGFDDLIVGAIGGDDGGTGAGEAYVVFGGAGGFGTTVNTGGYDRQVIDLTELSASQGFIIQGDEAGDLAGYSVSSAGDVNGDGFGDLIVGASSGDDADGSAGEAYVVFGAASGFGTPDGAGRQVIDLTTLTASQGFIIQGDRSGDAAGRAVSSAGDVNGDGFDDLIVGALYGDDGGGDAGEAYIVFGGASGFGTTVNTGGFDRQVIDLTTLSASQGFIIQGDVGGDYVGASVSSAGDVNGDGFDDLIVGAFGGDGGGTVAGEAYVVFGGAGGFGTDVAGRQVVDLTALSASQGLIIQGGAAFDHAGRSVASAGDINGDGYDDLIVGAPGGYSRAGETYVIFGGATGTESTAAVTRTGTASADNFTGNAGNDTFTGIGANDVVRGGAGDDAISLSATSFADIVGGTGTDTLALSGTGLTLNLTGAGTARIQSIEVIDLTGAGNNTVVLDQQAVFDLTEERSGGEATLTIRGNAGDTADLGGATGGFLANGTVSESGITYNVFSNGNANVRVQTGVTVLNAPPPAQAIDLTILSASQGFIVQGDTANDIAGISVSSAGDVNGDGFDDLIIGALGSDGGSGAGEAYVVFGGAGGFGTTVGSRQVIDLTTLSSAQGFVIQGDAAGDLTAYSVSSAGDVNGDGFADLIVGALHGDDGGTSAGEAYVVFGGSGAFGTASGGRQVIDLTSLSAGQGFIIQGDAADDQTGFSVSSAGDVNGDGFDDVIVGAVGGNGGGGRAGESIVVFGGAGTLGVVSGGREVIDLTNLSASQGFIIQGDSENDTSGISVSSAGDVNGDGFDDLIVGAPYGDDGGNNAGEAYVMFGGAGTLGTASGGRQVIDLTSLSASQGFIIQGDSVSDRIGRSVSSAGDINGDGFDDLIVGARYGTDGGANAGEAYVVFGAAGGFGTAVSANGSTRQVIDLTTLSASQGFIIQGDAADDRTGTSVSSAGDINGDGFDDLLVGAPAGGDGVYSTGEAIVVFGSAAGFGTSVGGRQVIDLTSFNTLQGFIIRGDSTGDSAGVSVSSAGDVNGDGFDDLFVGAPYGDDGGSSAGEGYVIFGGATGTESTVAVTRTGTASADNFTGNAGDDTFTSIGANDVVRGGAGDDAISLSATGFADIVGGTGIDTLSLSGSGLSLNLTGPGNAGVSSIEVIDLTGSGNNTVILDQQAVFDLTEERSGGEATLTIRGNAGDVVDLGGASGGFVANGSATDGGVTYDIYTNGNANVRVEVGVTVDNTSAAEDIGTSPKPADVAEPMGIASDWDSASTFETAKLEVLEDQPLDLNSGLGGAAGGFDAGDVWTPAGFAIEGMEVIDGGAAELAIQREAQLAADLLLIDAALATQGN